MGKLLFDEYPIIASYELAKLIGLNEAIVLQQIHYWIEINKKAGKNFRGGRYWTYNSIKNWHETNFAYWSIETVKRTFSKLEKFGYLISANFNKLGIDRTKWYSIDYEVLETLKSPIGSKCPNGESIPPMTQPLGQNDLMVGSKCPNGLGQNAPMDCVKMTQPIPETSQRLEIEKNISRDYKTTTTPPMVGTKGLERNVVVVSPKKEKKEPDTSPVSSAIKNIVFDNLNISLTQKQATMFDNLCDGDVNKLVEKVELLKSQTYVRNPVGWLISALGDDYHPGESISSATYNKPFVRDYANGDRDGVSL